MPKEAEMERMFMAMALMGMTTDLTCMKIKKVVAMRMNARARGRLSAMALRLSAL